MPAPILIIIYNRPDKVRTLVKKLNRLAPSEIFVCADGPRDLESEMSCADARREIEKLDSKHRVKKRYSERNLGCGLNVSSGISWFFEHVDRGIILEDDIEFDENFIRFCNLALEKFANDPSVFMISGAPYVSTSESGKVFFSNYPNIWGWATWRNSWEDYSPSMDGEGCSLKVFSIAYKQLSRVKAALFWSFVLHLCRTRKLDAWDHQMYYYMWKKNAFALTPSHPLTDNIGFDGDATAMTKRPQYLAHHDQSMSASAVDGLEHVSNSTITLSRVHDIGSEQLIFKTSILGIFKLIVKSVVWQSRKWG